jgi:hypothetical protein
LTATCHGHFPGADKIGIGILACSLFSFRMIGDTRIECQDANSAWEDTESKTVGSHRTGAEPRSPASAEVDEPLSTAGSQRELYLPALWNQSAEFLSLVETV